MDCRPGCDDCSDDPEMCVQCADRYYEDAGYCYKCQTGCFRCLSLSDCLKCEYGFVEVNGVCEKCDSTCLECSSNDTTFCTTCRKGLTMESGVCTH